MTCKKCKGDMIVLGKNGLCWYCEDFELENRIKRKEELKK